MFWVHLKANFTRSSPDLQQQCAGSEWYVSTLQSPPEAAGQRGGGDPPGAAAEC